MLAQNVDQLQQKINEHNTTIQQLNAEIDKYQSELNKTSAQAKTLQNAVKTLDLTSKKLNTDLKVTNEKINSATLQLKQLSNDINAKSSAIDKNKAALSEAVRSLSEADQASFIETLLTYDNISTFWNHVTTLEQFQTEVADKVNQLKELKQGLETNKQKTESKKVELTSLQGQLSDQKQSVEVTKSTKTQLLTETKNKESNYQKILTDKLATKAALEKELSQYESQLKLIIDPNSIPKVKAGILTWPTVSRIVTQEFGDTDFARKHTQAYNGKGHNGIDIAASIGAAIYSAQNGVVKGTGNTDTACPGASFGKWILVEHPNGLSTLYSHLSVIKVSAGQTVAAGETIGLAGITGYATGPHLHFTVYASEGVRIISRPSAACGGRTYTLPVADLKAYINPMLYL